MGKKEDNYVKKAIDLENWEKDNQPDIQKTVEPDTEIKNWLIEYVGEKLAPKNNEVTLEMVIEVVATEFPEFLLPIAEENFIRGYTQALEDVDTGRQLVEQDLKKLNKDKDINVN
tara:strand:+ start:1014 stop:1358 length:345 start_codon:yes stop_codon:yes gene_type:complete